MQIIPKTPVLRVFVAAASAFAAVGLWAATPYSDAAPDSVQQSIHHKASTLTQESLKQDQASSALDAVNGRVAGLTIVKSDNGVAAMNAVRVRGTTSLTGGNDPLVIIDGVIGDLSTLSSIYPADIESFSILKDASETAQYGSRGAAGVIDVRTKKGKAGRASVSYSGNYGFRKVYRNLKMLDADEYKTLVSQRGLMLIDKGYNTNWQREIERTAWVQDHHIAFSGGNQTTGYRVALAYIDHNGVIKNDNMRNFTSNLSIYQHMFDNRLRIDIGMFGNMLKNTTSIFDVQKMFYSAATFNPTFPAFRNADGGWDGFTYANQITHPLALLDSRTRDNNTHISTHAKITIDLGCNLNLVLFGAYSHNEAEKQQYLPTTIWAHGQAFRSSDKTESLMGNVALSWNTTIADKHRIELMALAEAQRDKLSGFYTTTTNFSNNDIGYDNIQAGALTLWEGTGSYREVPSLAAFMARASYTFDDRYTITATARADGSSRFGSSNKWGFFPSISGSWNIGKERFMKDVHWLDNLSLNAGYGLAGNQGGIGSYTSLDLVQPLGIVPVGNSAAVGLAVQKNINPDLKWEVKRTFNIGADAAFLGNRIIASLSYYHSKTSDMLYSYDVPTPPFTYSKLLANIGSMTNSGVELSMGFTPVKTKDLDLNINFNLAFQRNKLLSLKGYYGDYYVEANERLDIASVNGAGFHGGDTHVVYQIVGEPLGVFYLPHCTGIVPAADGSGYTYEIADLDGDGTLSTDDGKDRYVAGQATPKALLGSNISLRYKQWDLTLQMNGAFGHKIYNGTALTYMNMGNLPGYNVLKEAPEKNITSQLVTDYWLERGDYLNFDYVTLGWNVPLGSKVTKWVKSLRLSLTVSNLGTITGYSGLTPIINSSSIDSTVGVDDKRSYPLSRTYTLGVNVSF